MHLEHGELEVRAVSFSARVHRFQVDRNRFNHVSLFKPLNLLVDETKSIDMCMVILEFNVAT